MPVFDLTTLGATPTHTAGAATGQVTTYDISGQYDPVSDFPAYPLDVLADLNAVMGFFYVHLNYSQLDMSTAVLQAQVGDTDYYMIPSERLPLLLPLKAIGVPDPILAALDAPLRVLVEAGYNRTVSPGLPTTAKLLRDKSRHPVEELPGGDPDRHRRCAARDGAGPSFPHHARRSLRSGRSAGDRHNIYNADRPGGCGFRC